MTFFVAPNAVSLAQALFSQEAWCRAIYRAEELVGFVMVEDESQRNPPTEHPGIGVWRFMIDERQQGRGYGRAALRLVIDHARSRPGQTKLRTSCVPGPHSPIAFYERCGVRRTGEFDEDEEILELPLHAAR